MLDRLKALFADLERDAVALPDGALAPDDARVAVAALLVHMIRIDGTVTEDETATIRTALDSQFGLSGQDLEDVLAEAERRDDEAVDLYGFTSTLKLKLSEEERLDVIEMLWRAVFADGVVNELEDNMVWRTAELLGVSSRDRMILRKRIAGEAGTS
ncbi:MAG: TerB family tellurite resistance protein [Pseudomonadota bacterium]